MAETRQDIGGLNGVDDVVRRIQITPDVGDPREVLEIDPVRLEAVDSKLVDTTPTYQRKSGGRTEPLTSEQQLALGFPSPGTKEINQSNLNAFLLSRVLNP